MNTARCHNCGQDKTNFAAPYCDDCQTDVNTAREAAVAADEDPGAAQRSALWRRAITPRHGHADSRTQFQRQQVGDYLERLKAQRGGPDDPTRARLPIN